MQELQEWKNHLRELVPQIQEQIDWIEQGNVQARVNPSCPEKLKSVAGRLVEIQNTLGEYQRRNISKEDIERIKYYSKQNDIGFSDVVKLAVSNSRYIGASELEARGVAFYILEIQSVFKKYTGISAKHYYLNLRTIEASNLILSGATIREIADKMNFSSPNYFTTFFKNQTGLTPLEYKEKRTVG